MTSIRVIVYLLILQQTVMSYKRRNSQQYVNQFYCSPPIVKDPLFDDTLHQKYFKIYDKYSSQGSEAFTFIDQTTQKPCLKNKQQQIFKQKQLLKQIQEENTLLKKELADSKLEINRLRYELFYCRSQIDHIVNIQTNQYQEAIVDLQKEIEKMVERNKNNEEQLIQLKKHSSVAQQNQGFINKRTKFTYLSSLQLDKQNNSKESNKAQCKKTKEEINNELFIDGVKDMYSKINGKTPKNLQQLWKWVKQMGRVLSNFIKWRKKCRQSMRNQLKMNNEDLLRLINEAILITV